MSEITPTRVELLCANLYGLASVAATQEDTDILHEAALVLRNCAVAMRTSQEIADKHRSATGAGIIAHATAEGFLSILRSTEG